MMAQSGPWPLVINPRGRFGNRMFQYLLADRLRDRLGARAEVYGPGFPEWSIPARPFQAAVSRPLVLRGHLFDLDEVAHCLRSGICGAAVIEGWGMRVEYHPDPAPARDRFVSHVTPMVIDDDEILINVRAEDIESGAYPGYFPLPFAFYDAVIGSEGRRPVFMGQLAPSPYTDALRRRYRDARFLPVSSPAADFQTLRCARRLVLSISSFAWLAAWLSESATAIHLPVAGLFDPRRGRQNLLPLGDPRYRFWDVEFPAPAQRVGLDVVAWASGDRRAVQAEAGWLMALGAAALTAKVPMSVAAALADRRNEKGPAS